MRPGPHDNALKNFRDAFVSEEKVRYALRDPNKRRLLEALGYSEEVGNWRDLREVIIEGLSFHPARFNSNSEWGDIYYVDMIIGGPDDKEAPVRTGWIYRIGEDFPRLITLYVKSTEWRRMERKGRI